MMSALWKIKRKPRIENSYKSGDSVYQTLPLVSMFEFCLANLVSVMTFQLNCLPAPFPHIASFCPPVPLVDKETCSLAWGWASVVGVKPNLPRIFPFIYIFFHS